MLRFLLIILLLVAASAAAGAEDNYYYSDGRQIQLTPIDNKVVIGFAPIWGNQFSEFLTHYPQLVDTIQPSRIDEVYYIFYVYPGNNIDSLIDRLQQDTTVVLAQRVFTNELGGEEAFSNEIVVQTSGSLTPSEYDSVLTLYGLEELRINQFRPDIHYLCVTGQTARTVLETANAMYGERGFSFSHPVFRTRKYLPHYTPADPLFQWQYNYNNTRKYFNGSDSIPGKDIDACKAWEITKGSPDIKIAVIDEGITNHVDFPSGALIDTIDVTGAKHYDPKMDSNCAPWWQAAHGFAVSGLIIGQHNDKGIAGLVPNCKLIFIKIADDTARWPQREEPYADALQLAADRGANVISNSWGCAGCTVSDEMITALNHATNPGIDGHSCTIIFSAGNSGWDYYPFVNYPANMPQVLAVGATDSVDHKWYYSSWGETLEVMATSGNVAYKVYNFEPGKDSTIILGSIMTTDYRDGWGYNPSLYWDPYLNRCNVQWEPEDVGWDYFCSFGGTSAACPQVAGIAAMIMSRRPDLRDSNYVIYNIIEHSAEDTVGLRDGWEPDLPGWDQYYGWGRVNALRALLAVSRGDPNNDKTINAVDITYLINYLYKGGPAPVPDRLMGDAFCDGILNIHDIQYLINYLYRGGSAPLICFKY